MPSMVVNTGPWHDGSAAEFESFVDEKRGIVGFKCVVNGETSYVYLNPSSSGDSPDVFLYRGQTGDPGLDEPVCFVGFPAPGASVEHYVVALDDDEAWAAEYMQRWLEQSLPEKAWSVRLKIGGESPGTYERMPNGRMEKYISGDVIEAVEAAWDAACGAGLPTGKGEDDAQ